MITIGDKNRGCEISLEEFIDRLCERVTPLSCLVTSKLIRKTLTVEIHRIIQLELDGRQITVGSYEASIDRSTDPDASFTKGPPSPVYAPE